MKAVQVYFFSELDPKVQAKVLDKNRDINVDHNWYEYIISEWNKKLESIGFINAEISFSGFYSQGDGCCFKSSLDLDHFLINDFEPLKKEEIDIAYEPYLGWTAYRQGKFVSYGCLSNDEMNQLCDSLVEFINEYKVDLCVEIYEDLRKQYEYLTTDEAVKETIELNEYVYLIDGASV